MIHMGAMVGGNLTQGRSRTLNWSPSFLGRFRNTQDRRDFITGGAAAGVSAAFGAPIGYVSPINGVAKTHSCACNLQRLALRKRGSCLFLESKAYLHDICWLFNGNICCFLAEFSFRGLDTFGAIWLLLGRFHHPVPGQSIYPDAHLHYATDYRDRNMRRCHGHNFHLSQPEDNSIPESLFCPLQDDSTSRHLPSNPFTLFPPTYSELAEPCIVVVVFSSLCLFLPLAFPCEPKPEQPIDDDNYRLIKHACNNDAEYSPLATVILARFLDQTTRLSFLN